MLLDPFIKIELHLQIHIIIADFSNTSEEVKRLENAKNNSIVSFPEERTGEEKSEYFSQKQSHKRNLTSLFQWAHGLRVTRVQGYKGARNQGYMVTRLQGYKVTRA